MSNTASRDPNRVPTLLGISSSDGKTPTPVAVDPVTNRLLVNTVISSAAVTVADGADVAEGTTTDPAVTGDSSGTVSGKLRGINKTLSASLPAALGQTTMAGSVPVTLASNQTNIKASTYDGAGTAITSTLVSGKQGLDMNIVGATNITTNPAYSSATGTITAAQPTSGSPVAGGTVSIPCQAYTSVIFEVSGTYTGITLVFEQQAQGTGGWFPCFMNPIVSPQTTIVASTALVNNSNVAFQGTVGASVNFRVRGSLFTTGPLNVFLAATTDPLQYGENLAIETGGNLAIVAGSIISSRSQVNVAQMNGVQVLMGNGVSGTGSQRVNIASNNTPFQVEVIGNAGAIFDGATSAAAPANAIYAGFLAKTALPTAASDGNQVGGMSDKFGRRVTLPFSIRDLASSQTTTISASTSETTIVTAASSIFNDLTALVVSNTSATAVRVDFRDTTGGSVLFSLYVPAGDARGISFSNAQPQTTVNTNWTAQSSASVTDLRVFAQFVKNK